MRIQFAILIGLGGLMAGCLDRVQDVNGPQSSEKQESHIAIAARFDGATTFFNGYTEMQSNGGQNVEAFADCGLDQVMTGIGGSVGAYRILFSSYPYVNGVTAYCRSINSDGSLATQTSVVYGSSNKQSVVYADPDKVVVGVGGTVTNFIFNRVLILQCHWQPSTLSVDPSSCSWKGSDGSTSAELYYDVQSAVAASQRPKTIATGAGFATQLTDNVKVIRLTMASLK